jgi:hypothetical protein
MFIESMVEQFSFLASHRCILFSAGIRKTPSHTLGIYIPSENIERDVTSEPVCICVRLILLLRVFGFVARYNDRPKDVDKLFARCISMLCLRELIGNQAACIFMYAQAEPITLICS